MPAANNLFPVFFRPIGRATMKRCSISAKACISSLAGAGDIANGMKQTMTTIRNGPCAAMRMDTPKSKGRRFVERI